MKSKQLLVVLCIAVMALGALTAVASAATTVTIWGWRAEAAVWQQVEQQLKAAGHDININYETFKATEYDSKMTLSLQGGKGPDIVYTRRLPGARTESLIDANLIVPLDGKVDFSNFSQATLNFIQTDGKTWGIPFANQIIGIFYNKDYYDQFGLKEPATWDELVHNAQVLKENGIDPFFIPGKAAWALAMQHAMTGVSILGPDWIKKLHDGEVNFMDPAWIDLNTRLNDLKQYYQKDFMANSTEDMDAAFAFGQAGMVFYGIWATERNWKELNPDLNIGYFPVPPKTTDDKAYAYVYMDGSFALNANAKHRDAALEVLKFTATPAYGTILANTNGELPAVLGAELPKDKPLLQEGLDTTKSSAAESVYWVGSVLSGGGQPTLYDLLSTGMQEMYLGRITPEEFAQKSQDGVSSWYKPLQK